MAQRTVGPIRWTFIGNYDESRKYIKIASLFHGMMKERMSLLGLRNLTWRRRLKDGTVIELISVNGLEHIKITAEGGQETVFFKIDMDSGRYRFLYEAGATAPTDLFPVYTGTTIRSQISSPVQLPINNTDPQTLIGPLINTDETITLDGDNAYKSFVYEYPEPAEGATQSEIAAINEQYLSDAVDFVVGLDPCLYTGLMRLGAQAKLGAYRDIDEIAPISNNPWYTGLLRDDDYNYYSVTIGTSEVRAVKLVPASRDEGQSLDDRLDAGSAISSAIVPMLSDTTLSVEVRRRLEAYYLSTLIGEVDDEGLLNDFRILGDGTSESVYSGGALHNEWHFAYDTGRAASIVLWDSNVSPTDFYWITDLVTISFSFDANGVLSASKTIVSSDNHFMTDDKIWIPDSSDPTSHKTLVPPAGADGPDVGIDVPLYCFYRGDTLLVLEYTVSTESIHNDLDMPSCGPATGFSYSEIHYNQTGGPTSMGAITIDNLIFDYYRETTSTYTISGSTTVNGCYASGAYSASATYTPSSTLTITDIQRNLSGARIIVLPRRDPDVVYMSNFREGSIWSPYTGEKTRSGKVPISYTLNGATQHATFSTGLVGVCTGAGSGVVEECTDPYSVLMSFGWSESTTTSGGVEDTQAEFTDAWCITHYSDYVVEFGDLLDLASTTHNLFETTVSYSGDLYYWPQGGIQVGGELNGLGGYATAAFAKKGFVVDENDNDDQIIDRWVGWA